MINKLVSIIIPIYNTEQYLCDCIDSILNQTYENIELILVNDGSTDNSLQLCKRYITNNKVVVFNKSNGGVSSARNKGLELAKGDYIIFVDSDDILPYNAVDILVNESSDRISAIFGLSLYQYDNGRRILHKSRLDFGIHESRSLLAGFIDNGTLGGFLISSACCALYRRDIIQKFNLKFLEGLKINEDGLFNLEYLMKSENILVIDRVVYIVRKHYDSSSQNRSVNYDYNSIIINYLKGTNLYDKIPLVENQFQCRIVSIALWTLLIDAKKMPYKESIKLIKSSVSNSTIIKAYDSINPGKLKLPKKVMFYLMKYKMVHTIYFFVKCVIPFFVSRISR